MCNQAYGVWTNETQIPVTATWRKSLAGLGNVPDPGAFAAGQFNTMQQRMMQTPVGGPTMQPNSSWGNTFQNLVNMFGTAGANALQNRTQNPATTIRTDRFGNSVTQVYNPGTATQFGMPGGMNPGQSILQSPILGTGIMQGGMFGMPIIPGISNGVLFLGILGVVLLAKGK